MKKHIHGGNIYQYENCLDFSANCNPLGTPEAVKRAARESLSHIQQYPRVDCGPLRKAIGAYEGVDWQKVVCGNGAAELIFSLCRAAKPKRALIPAPTFAEYEQALESVDCRVDHFLLEERTGFALPADFAEAIGEDTDMIFLCNPNNPTGILTGRDRLLEILDVCREKRVLAVVDECFLDFVREPEAYTLKNELDRYRNLLILKAFTKRYAMAGLRLGYGLCADEELLERMEAVTQPWNVSTVAQEAGVAALLETDYVEAGRKLVFEEAGRLKEKLTELGLTVFPSAANYIFFRGPEGFFEDCVREGILIRDCSNYPGLGAGYYRIAVKLPEENKRLIDAFGKILGRGIAPGKQSGSGCRQKGE